MAMQHTEPSYTNWEWGLTGRVIIILNHGEAVRCGASVTKFINTTIQMSLFPDIISTYLQAVIGWILANQPLSKILLGLLSTYPLIYHLNSLPELKIIILYKEAEIQRSKKFGSPWKIDGFWLEPAVHYHCYNNWKTTNQASQSYMCVLHIWFWKTYEHCNSVLVISCFWCLRSPTCQSPYLSKAYQWQI